MELWAVAYGARTAAPGLRDVVHHSINTEWARAYGKDAPVYGTVGAAPMIAGSAGVARCPGLGTCRCPPAELKHRRRNLAAVIARHWHRGIFQCRLRIS